MFNTKPVNQTQAAEKGSLPYLQARNRNRRMNLLLILAFTAVNMVLLFTNADSYFLFSALLPYWLFAFGYFQGISALMVAGGAVLLVYLVLFLLWDKHPAFPVAALVLFALDCVFLVWLCLGKPISNYLIDIVFHVAMLYYLINGATNAFALRKKQREAAALERANQGPEL